MMVTWLCVIIAISAHRCLFCSFAAAADCLVVAVAAVLLICCRGRGCFAHWLSLQISWLPRSRLAMAMYGWRDGWWRDENSWWRDGWWDDSWDSDGWRSRNNWAAATVQQTTRATAPAYVQQAAPRGGTRAPTQMGHLAAPQAAVAAVAPAGIARSRIAGEGMELTPSLQLRLRSIRGPSEDDLPDGEVLRRANEGMELTPPHQVRLLFMQEQMRNGTRPPYLPAEVQSEQVPQTDGASAASVTEALVVCERRRNAGGPQASPNAAPQAAVAAVALPAVEQGELWMRQTFDWTKEMAKKARERRHARMSKPGVLQSTRMSKPGVLTLPLPARPRRPLWSASCATGGSWFSVTGAAAGKTVLASRHGTLLTHSLRTSPSKSEMRSLRAEPTCAISANSQRRVELAWMMLGSVLIQHFQQSGSARSGRDATKMSAAQITSWPCITCPRPTAGNFEVSHAR